MSALSDVRCIVDGSTGPLVRRKIVPQSVYDGISEQIIAKQK